MTGPGALADAAAGTDILVEVTGYLAVVRSSEEDIRRAIRLVFRGFLSPGEPGTRDTPVFQLEREGNLWRVIAKGDPVHEGDDFLVALGMLEFHLLSAALDRSTDRFQLHGAALCAPTSRAGIVLSGDSGIGKTTLALALMLRGFVPFSDDVALIEPDTLRLHPLRRAFHINADTWPMLEPLARGRLLGDPDGPPGYFYPPQWATTPVPVRWLVFLERATDRPPALIQLQPAAAAAAILAQSGTLAVAARMALRTASQLVERAECYRLITGDLEGTVAVVQELVLTGR